MTITVSVPDQLGDRAASQGLTVEAYVEELAARAVADEITSEENGNRRKAVQGLRAFRKQHRLTLERDRSSGLRAWLHQDHKR